MLAHRRVLVPLVAALGLVGAAAAFWFLRAEEPLAPLAVETLAPPSGIDLPHHVVSGGDDGTAFALDSPVEDTLEGGTGLTIVLARPPHWSQVGIVWAPVDQLGTAEEYTEWQRRHPEDSQLVGDVVVEHSSLGVAYRKDLELDEALTTTQWTIEHDDDLYLVEWIHHPDDTEWRPTVEAMIDSWRWR